MDQSSDNLKIIFIGTSEFAAIILDKLAENNLRPILVVTAQDKPVGRKQIITPPPVKSEMLKRAAWNIPILQPDNIKDLESEIKDLKPDLIVVASYGQIIQKEILDTPKYGCLNVHPSLLPKYRGPSPIQSAILNGENETGVTIMLMDEKIDHGPIIAKEKLEKKIEKLTYKELYDRLAKIGAELLIKTIPGWIEKKIKPLAQDDSRATFTKILKKEDGKIDWSKTSQDIQRMVFALNPWPGTYTNWQTKEKQMLMKILETDIVYQVGKKAVGEVFLTAKNQLAVWTGPVQKQKSAFRGKGRPTGQNCLILQKLQLEGSKPMSSQDFLRGHQEIIGTILN